jgi:hypothetical protein
MDKAHVLIVRHCRQVASSVLPAVILVLRPKCPICIAACIAMVTGIGLSLPVTAHLRTLLKHHRDAYAFVDLYPFASVAPKESYWPNFNVGVPLTSQSLHRPYVGAAENVSHGVSERGSL